MLPDDETVNKDVVEAVSKLLISMGPERLVQLAELIVEIADDTGFGDVKIVVAEGLVVRLKAEKSY